MPDTVPDKTSWGGHIFNLNKMGVSQIEAWMNITFVGFPDDTRGKEHACQCKRHARWGFDP